MNNYKFIRGFSAYDEWQQSGASLNTVTPYYRREKQVDCRACHMPKVESTNDLAAHDGAISSHRWIGANTTTPLFYGQTKQVELTKAFLENKVISLDIFALKSEATGRFYAPLDSTSDNQIALQSGEAVTVEVVVFNRKAAHSFPPELRDMYEPWVEFEALDSSGKTIFHSGFIKADGTLDESAHVYKQIILDENARAIVTIVNPQAAPRKNKSGPPPTQKVNPELQALRWQARKRRRRRKTRRSRERRPSRCSLAIVPTVMARTGAGKRWRAKSTACPI
ncbi:MAG TPA: hypothetical protein VGN95_05395 [Pyrinomonadaceae bacterium]|nr:hypothetical protein [Pyrinomonadaceae bacterium]